MRSNFRLTLLLIQLLCASCQSQIHHPIYPEASPSANLSEMPTSAPSPIASQLTESESLKIDPRSPCSGETVRITGVTSPNKEFDLQLLEIKPLAQTSTLYIMAGPPPAITAPQNIARVTSRADGKFEVTFILKSPFIGKEQDEGIELIPGSNYWISTGMLSDSFTYCEREAN